MSLHQYRHQKNDRIQNYVLDEPLGVGGFAEVWRALDKDHGWDTFVALKIFYSESSQWSQIRARAQREADILAHFASNRIVPIRRVQLANSPPFMAMVCMHGDTLAARIEKGEGLQMAPLLDEEETPEDLHARRVKDLAPVFEQLVDALQEVHDARLVHRDVKPSNVLFERKSTVEEDRSTSHGPLRLADFGIAHDANPKNKETREDSLVVQSERTGFGIVLGTPGYMAPEQIKPETERDPVTGELVRKPITPAADIYAAGVILYEMLSGERPMEGQDATEIMVKWELGKVTPIGARIPCIKPRLKFVIDTCLERMPGDRFRNCKALRKAFDLAVEEYTGEPIQYPPKKPIRTPIPQPPPTPKPFEVVTEPRPITNPIQHPVPPPRKYQRVQYMAACLVIGVAIAAYFLRGGDTPPPIQSIAPSQCVEVKWETLPDGDPRLSECSGADVEKRRKQIDAWKAADWRRVSTTLRQSAKEFTEYFRLSWLVC